MVSDLRTLTFSELVCFVEVSRAGGVTAAAENLGIAKSVVSKRVTRLEEHLQVALLERTSRRVRLTRAGERLLPQIESLLADGDRLVEQAKDERGQPEGLVRIAATPEFGALVAREFLPRASETFPKLQLVMRTTYAFEDLQDPTFDLGIRVGKISDDRLVPRYLGSFRRILVASPDYLESCSIEDPQDLANARCLIFSGSRSTSTWTLEREDAETQIHCEVSGPLAVRSFATVTEMAQAGAGVAYVPDFVAAEGLASRRLVRCLPAFHSRPSRVNLVFRPGSDRVRRVKVILDLATKQLPRLLSEPGSI